MEMYHVQLGEIQNQIHACTHTPNVNQIALASCLAN